VHIALPHCIRLNECILTMNNIQYIPVLQHCIKGTLCHKAQENNISESWNWNQVFAVGVTEITRNTYDNYEDHFT